MSLRMDSDIERFRGLNMNHGFIKSIVKNQIDRDEYHKVMEERRTEVKQKIQNGRASPSAESASSPRPSSSRQTPVVTAGCPGMQLYVPPHLRKSHGLPMKAKHRQERSKPQCPAIVSEIEETTLREKVRNRTRAKMDDLDDLNLPTSPGNSNIRQPAKPLFMLNMKSPIDGVNVEVAVMSSDNAARLAKELGRKYEFTEQQCRLLRQTLDRELEARLNPPVVVEQL